MLDLLRRLLRERPAPLVVAGVGDWWRRFSDRSRAAAPIDLGVLAGFFADRVAFAFAGGYQAALRALFSPIADAAIASFCATERGGNQPRAIETRLDRRGDGYTVSGAKRWSTMAPLASVLFVVASEGSDEAGRRRLRVVRVGADAPGVTITTMPPTAFVPEVPHAEIALADVDVAADAILPGDGYATYVKPFRTVEDLHIHGALLGYLVSVARRHAFSADLVERLLASIAATRALALADPAAPEVHLALAGLLAADARLIDDLGASWERVGDDERARWERDRTLFGSVAGQVRELRRRRAWEAVADLDPEQRPTSGR